MPHKLLYIFAALAFVAVSVFGTVGLVPASAEGDTANAPQTEARMMEGRTMMNADLNQLFQNSDIFRDVDKNAVMNFLNQIKTNLNNKSGDDFDKAYIETMIGIHQMHNEIANIGVSRSNHNELRNASQEMLNSSNQEMDRMMNWHDQWFR